MHRTTPEVAVALGKAIQAYDEKQRCLRDAAPEMLTALKRCLAMVTEGAGPPNWDWIREVVAKAEGR